MIFAATSFLVTCAAIQAVRSQPAETSKPILISASAPSKAISKVCDGLRTAGLFTCAETWDSGAIGYSSQDGIASVQAALQGEVDDWTVAEDSPLMASAYDYVVDATPRSFAGRFSFENSIGLFAVTDTLSDSKRKQNTAATLRTSRRSMRTPSRVNIAGSALSRSATSAKPIDNGVTSNIAVEDLRIADDFSQGNSTSRTLVVQHGTTDLGSLSAYAGGCLRACRSPTNFFFAAPGSNVTVYVIDTPVADHVQFKQVQTGESRLAVEEYLSPSARNATGNCARDLGTHAAAAVGGFEFGSAKDVDIVSVGVRPGCGGQARVSDLLAGLDWIYNHYNSSIHPDSAVALLPFVISAHDPAAELVKRSIERLVSVGVSFAVAAGDTHEDACQYVPANMESVVTVGGALVSDGSDSAKPWAWSNFDKCVDIFAPAVDVRSASPECFECTASLSRTGTAAARVAGIMTQFVQTNTNASSSDVKRAVLGGGTNQLIQNPQFPYRRTTRLVAQSLLNLSVFEVRGVV